MHSFGSYSPTVMSFLSGLLLPEERGPRFDRDVACPVTGLRPLVGRCYKLHNECKHEQTGAAPRHESPEDKLISAFAFERLTGSEQAKYEVVHNPSQTNHGPLSRGDRKAYVYSAVKLALPEAWSSRSFSAPLRMDVRLNGGSTLDSIRSTCRVHLTSLSGISEGGVQDWDVWWQLPGRPPAKLPACNHGLGMLGFQDLDVLVFTDAGTAPPERIETPSPHEQKFTSRLGNLKHLDISGNLIDPSDLSLFRERAQIWCPDMELVA